jgi:hypothetical protein
MDRVTTQNQLARPVDARADVARTSSWFRVVCARLLIGWIVLLCAEGLSGASLPAGLWAPWTLVITYWLYFAHFFFFTTLAVRTGRTSLSCLYLWGVVFGLYESWITKVIWSGYSHDGKFAMGSIGPYGFSEISMVFIFHPVVSFILPLAIACLFVPSLRRFFPGVAWLTGRGIPASMARAFLVFSFAPIVAMNGQGPANLALNIAFGTAVFVVLLRLARPALGDARTIVVFGGQGFAGLCVYLVLLYAAGYFLLFPKALPSSAVQLFTFVFYALAIGGLWLHRRREPLAGGEALPENRELRLVALLTGALLVLALTLSMLPWTDVLGPAVALTFIIWTLSGFLILFLSLAIGIREWVVRADS